MFMPTRIFDISVIQGQGHHGSKTQGQTFGIYEQSIVTSSGDLK
mgnify:CR=1 FL=1